MTNLRQYYKPVNYLIVLVVSLAFILQSCTSFKQETVESSPTTFLNNAMSTIGVPTSTNTPTVVPSPTIIPTATYVPYAPLILAEGWQGTKVETLCLSVNQTGTEGIPGFPVLKTLQDIFPRLGIQVVEEGQDCQAQLSLSIEFFAEAEEYIGVGLCYSGAQANSMAILSMPGKPNLEVSGFAEIMPPQAIIGCPTEQQAPVGQVWQGAVFSTLGQVWGDLLFARLWDMPDIPEEVRRGATGLFWGMQEPEPEILPVLESALHSPDQVARLGAVKAIRGLILANKEDKAYTDLLARISRESEPEIMTVLLDTVAYLDNVDDAKIIVQILINAIRHTDTRVRADAVARLGYYSEFKAEYAASGLDLILFPVLIDLLNDPDVFVQSAAIEAVADWEVMDAVPVLIELLRNIDTESDPDLLRIVEPSQIASALEEITGESFGMDADAWQNWWDSRQP